LLAELKATEFERVRPLFAGFEYSLSIEAAILGNNPSRIFVDDVHNPKLGFALTVEGYLLTGEYEDPRKNASLQQLFENRIFTGEVFVNGNTSMSLAVHPEAWETKLPELIPTHEVEKLERYHYQCNALRIDWRKSIPEGYSVQRIDQALLHEGEVSFSGQVRGWMDIEEMWWTEENFLTNAISYVVVFDREVVAWCNPDCVAGGRIDVGVFTHPAHRRRGLASAVVAATVEDCLCNGFTVVGWHCNLGNVGSWKTAEKVGFKRNLEYAYYYYMYDIVDHLAELGWYYYRLGDYAKCVKYYEQVFTLRQENPDYYHHLVGSAWALMGNGEKALAYLSAAAKQGWSNTAYTQEQEEFSIIQGAEEWEAILARMAENEKLQDR
jgi:RimJ/RimL family protein N-acetyltransferase